MPIEPYLPDTAYPLPESLHASRCVFKGRRFDVCSLEVKVDEAHSVRREAVVHPGSVVILPILDRETILLIRNQRFAVGERLWELPAGTLEPQEPPLETAKREIIEETGYRADQVDPLLTFYTTPGFCTEKMYAFVAQGLHLIGQKLDEGEDILVETVSWKKALAMIDDGTIRDAKTLVTLLYYNNQKR